MQKTYTVTLTANEVNLLMQLVESEASYYDEREDYTDTAHFDNCNTVLEKLYNAN